MADKIIIKKLKTKFILKIQNKLIIQKSDRKILLPKVTKHVKDYDIKTLK